MGENNLSDEIGQPLFWWNAQGSILNWRNIPVEFLNHTAFIYDLKGAVVCQFNLDSNTSRIGLPILPDGIYLVRIDSLTQKLIVNSEN